MRKPRTPTLQLQREGPYYAVQNMEDRYNLVFNFLTFITNKGWWDCKVSRGPYLYLNCIKRERLSRFVEYANSNGIKVEVK